MQVLKFSQMFLCVCSEHTTYVVCFFLCVSELVRVCITEDVQAESPTKQLSEQCWLSSSLGERGGVGLSTRHTDDSPLSASPQPARGLVSVRVFVCSAPAETSANLIITNLTMKLRDLLPSDIHWHPPVPIPLLAGSEQPPQSRLTAQYRCTAADRT